MTFSKDSALIPANRTDIDEALRAHNREMTHDEMADCVKEALDVFMNEYSFLITMNQFEHERKKTCDTINGVRKAIHFLQSTKGDS